MSASTRCPAHSMSAIDRFDCNKNGTPQLDYELLTELGIKDFRKGQKQPPEVFCKKWCF